MSFRDELIIHKVTLGKDGLIYLTITHPKALNHPTLVFTESNFDWLKSEIVEQNENSTL
jgi:hypothetical protein